MRIWRDLAAIPAAERGAAIAIGNMDGVHLGHRALIGRARAIAAERGCPAAALTFEPHPRLLFQPDAAPFLLYGLEEKLALLAGTGLDAAYVPWWLTRTVIVSTSRRSAARWPASCGGRKPKVRCPVPLPRRRRSG